MRSNEVVVRSLSALALDISKRVNERRYIFQILIQFLLYFYNCRHMFRPQIQDRSTDRRVLDSQSRVRSNEVVVHSLSALALEISKRVNERRYIFQILIPFFFIFLQL